MLCSGSNNSANSTILWRRVNPTKIQITYIRKSSGRCLVSGINRLYLLHLRIQESSTFNTSSAPVNEDLCQTYDVGSYSKNMIMAIDGRLGDLHPIVLLFDGFRNVQVLATFDHL